MFRKKKQILSTNKKVTIHTFKFILTPSFSLFKQFEPMRLKQVVFSTT